MHDKLNQYLYRNHPELFAVLHYHKNHKNEFLTFENYLYLRDIYLDKSDYMALRKSTQCGLTEFMIIKALHKAKEGKGVFYILPTYSLVSRFVKNRIDRTIDFTPVYKSWVKKKSQKYSESVSLKHIGKGVIAFNGSNASASFTEFPADILMIDEVDECDQENLPMADERLSASKHKERVKLGNPTIEGIGIDAEYKASDMKRWLIKCDHCGNRINPDFFKHVVREMESGQYLLRDKNYQWGMNRDIHLICDNCGKPVNRFGKGEWVKTHKNIKRSGYHISKLFSTNVKITELIERFNEGLADDTKLQRFYNGDLGLAYTASGSKITSSILDGCIQDYNMPNELLKGTALMGIDVGNYLHVMIAELMPDGILKILFIDKVKTYEDIKILRKLYKVRVGCVDALPEQRLSKKICGLSGFFRVFYGRDIKKDRVDVKGKVVTIDRTSTMDEVRAKYFSQHIYLPKNASKLHPLIKTSKGSMSEFYYQMTAPTRIYDKAKEAYKWVEGDKPDHYYHANNYMIIALRILKKFINK